MQGGASRGDELPPSTEASGPAHSGTGEATRIRPLLREGLTLLLGRSPEPDDGAFLDRVRAAASDATPAPLTALYLHDVDTTGALTAALAPEPGQAWLVRPDAHIAAVVPGTDTAAVRSAVRTALGAALGRAVPPRAGTATTTHTS